MKGNGPLALNGKHLHRRRGRYSVKVAVPKALRAQFTSPHIEIHLRTSDRDEAALRYSAALAEIKRRLERARKMKPLTADEIEAQKTLELRGILASLERRPEDADLSLDGTLDAMTDYQTGEVGLEALRPRALAIIDRLHAAPTEATITALCEALASAVFDADTYWRHKLPAPGAPRLPLPRASISISEAAERFLVERQRDPSAKLAVQTVSQRRATFRLFAGHMNDCPLSDVRRQDATGFLNALGELDRSYGQRPGAATLSLHDLVKRYPAAEGQGLSNKTINQHQISLKTLYDWASMNGTIPEDRINPFAGLARPKGKLSETTWQPYTIPELRQLFAGLAFDLAPASHSLASALPWIMLIALFSGMRQGEIADLDVSDIKRDEGVDYFDITSAKSEAGIRRVPLHSELIRLGLLEYVATIGTGALFPGIKTGGRNKRRAHTIAKKFPAFRRAHGITRERLSFHSFRKCFVRALEIARVDHDRAALVIGHERGFTFGTYNPAGLPLWDLRAVVELVRYEGLSLPQASLTGGP